MPFNILSQNKTGITGATSSAAGIINVLPEIQYSIPDPVLINGQYINARSDASGNLRQNPGIYQYAATETGVSVATSDTSLLVANPMRTYLMIQNQDGTNPIYIATDGGASVADSTCFKLIAGASREWNLGSGVPVAAIKAIATGGSVNVHVEEG